jgi:hypothetical protein
MAETCISRNDISALLSKKHRDDIADSLSFALSNKRWRRMLQK